METSERNGSPGNQPITPRQWLALLLAAVVLDGLLLAGWCAAFLPQSVLPEPVAYHLSLSSNTLAAVILFGSPAAIIVALIMLARKRTRKPNFLAFVLVFFVVAAPMHYFVFRPVYWSVHHSAVRAVPPRGEELVAALQAYEAEHGDAPPNLDALVPEYIREVPGTGLAGFPRFEYRLLEGGGEHPPPYELFMPCPYSYAGPSALLYWPWEDYLVNWPEDAKQRLRDSDWVYVNMK